MENMTLPDYVVLAAGVSFVAGYMIINQVALRLAVMVGTCFYIWYYAIAAEEPLWVAIWTSIAMGTANLFGLFSLWLRSSPISIPRKHRDIYAHFNILPPGDFRKLMSAAKRSQMPAGTVLTTSNARVKSVYYVMNGSVAVDKFGDRFYLPDGIFLGEVGYLTGNRASATAVLTADSDVLAWDVADLKTRSDRDVRFKLALDALISLDLAEKVARAGSPRSEDQVAPNMGLNNSAEFSRNPYNDGLNLVGAGSK